MSEGVVEELWTLHFQMLVFLFLMAYPGSYDLYVLLSILFGKLGHPAPISLFACAGSILVSGFLSVS